MTVRTQTARRRHPIGLYLFAAILIVPVIEIYLIVRVGQTIGGLSTFALLLLWSLVGAWLIKREGAKTFRGLRDAFRTARIPTKELADAALVLIGGALLLLPGFFTDVIGLLLILPFTRPLTRKLLQRAVAAKLFGPVSNSRVVVTRTTSFRAHDDRHQSGPYPYPRGQDEIVEGEIID